MPWLAAAAVAGPIVGGLIGNMQAQKDRRAQKQMMKEALSELKKAGLPPDLSKEIIFEKFQQVGIYTPELEEDLSDSVAESAMEDIKEDPALREAQIEALSSMKQRGKVGLSAEDRAALNQVRSEVQRDSEAKRQQILQQMQSRGMGGSGAELMAQLQSAQGAADQAASGSDTLMAQAQQRAMEAIKSSAGLAGDVRSQDFGVAADKAKAVDERNRFLAENSIARQQRNVGTLNQAQLTNLQEQQRITDYNIQQANQEKLRQVAEQGNLYDRTLGYRQSMANAYTGQAQQAGQQAANTAQMYSGIGSAVGTGVGGYAQQQSNERIAAMKAGKAADGGIVGDPETTGATAGPDNVLMNLRDGEMVLNADQQKGLFDFINRISKKFPKE